MTKEQVRKLTKKLSSGTDITKEEADAMYLYVLSNKLKDTKVLSMWYGVVCNALRSGMEGNYITTVPLFTPNQKIDTLEDCKKELERHHTFSVFGAENEFIPNNTDIPGVSVRKKNEEYSCIEIKRAGMMDLLNIDISKFYCLPSMSRYALKYLNYYFSPEQPFLFFPGEGIQGYVMAEICRREKINLFCVSFDPWYEAEIFTDTYITQEDYDKLQFYEMVSEPELLSYLDEKTLKAIKKGKVSHSIILECVKVMEKLAKIKRDLFSIPFEQPEILLENDK